MVLKKDTNANNDGHMYLKKSIIGVVVIGVGTCCCSLRCCLLTRHNHIDFYVVVHSVHFSEYPLIHC